jgi:hypothetical protein
MCVCVCVWKDEQILSKNLWIISYMTSYTPITIYISYVTYKLETGFTRPTVRSNLTL